MDNYKPQPKGTQLKGAFARLKESDRQMAEKVFMSILRFIAYAETKKEKRDRNGKFTVADLAEIEMEEVDVIED